MSWAYCSKLNYIAKLVVLWSLVTQNQISRLIQDLFGKSSSVPSPCNYHIAESL